MNNITIIEHPKLVRAVSARELHEFLEVRTDFTNWCKRMNEYLDLQEGIDYVVVNGNRIYAKNGEKSDNGRGRPSVDYFYVVDAAKEISMGQGTEKGKEARKYFIECERKLKEQQEMRTRLSNFDITNPTDVIGILSEISNVYLKQNAIIKQERDNAVKTKAWIGARREATAMATASTMTRKVYKLEDELGIGRNFKQVKAIKDLTKYFYVNKGFYIRVGNILKELSNRRGYKIKRTSHSEYGEINAYDVELINEFLSEIDTNSYISNKLSRYRKY
jgi:phage anti-repressor protein